MAEEKSEIPLTTNEIPLSVPQVPEQPGTPPVLPLTLHPDHPTESGLTLEAERKIAEAANACLEYLDHIIELKNVALKQVTALPGFDKIPDEGEVGNFQSLNELLSYLVVSLIKVRARHDYNYVLNSISVDELGRYMPKIFNAEMNKRIREALFSGTALPSNKEIEEMFKQWFINARKRLPKPEEADAWLVQQTDGLKTVISGVGAVSQRWVKLFGEVIALTENNNMVNYHIEEILKNIYNYMKSDTSFKYFRLKEDKELYPFDLTAINADWGKYCQEQTSYTRRVMRGSGVIMNSAGIAHSIRDSIRSARTKAVNVTKKYIDRHELIDEVKKTLRDFLVERIKNSDFEKAYGGLFKYIYNEKGDDLKPLFIESIIKYVDAKPFGQHSNDGDSMSEKMIETEFSKQLLAALESGVRNLSELENTIKDLTKSSKEKILQDAPGFAENWLTLTGDNNDKFMELIKDKSFLAAPEDEQNKILKSLTSTLPLQVLPTIGPSLEFNRVSLQKKIKKINDRISSEKSISDEQFINEYFDLKRDLLTLKKSQMFSNMISARRDIKMKVARDIGATFENATNMILGKAADSRHMTPSDLSSHSARLKNTIINEMITNKNFLPLRELGEELEKLQLAHMRAMSKSLNESPHAADIPSLVLRVLTAQEPNNSEVYIPEENKIANIHRSGTKYYLIAQFLHDDRFLIEPDAPADERRKKATELARLIFEFLSTDTSDSEYSDQYDYNDSLVAYRAAFNHAYKSGASPSAMVEVAEAFAPLIHDNSFTDLHLASTRESFTNIVTHPNFKDIAKSHIVQQLMDTFAKLAWANSNIINDETLDDKLVKLVSSRVATQSQVDNAKYIMDIIKNKKPINFDRDSLLKLQAIIRDGEYIIEAVSNSSFTEFMQYHEPKDEMVQDAVKWEQPAFRFQALRDRSPEHFTIGIHTDCCQHLGGAGANAAIDSFINSLAGVLTMEVKDGEHWELAYQSYFHYIPEQKAYILDNIEGVEKYFGKIKKLTGHEADELYALWAQHMKGKYPELTYIALGLSYTKIPTSRFAPHVQEEDPRRFHDHVAGDEYSDYDENNGVNLLEFNSEIPITENAYHSNDDESAIVLGGNRDDYVVKINDELSTLRNNLWASSSGTPHYSNFNRHERLFKRIALQFLAMHGVKKSMNTPIEEIDRAIQKITAPVRAARLLYRSKLFEAKMKRGIK